VGSLSAASLPTSGARQYGLRRRARSSRSPSRANANSRISSSPQSELLGRSAGSRGATTLRCAIRIRVGGCLYAAAGFADGSPSVLGRATRSTHGSSSAAETLRLAFVTAALTPLWSPDILAVALLEARYANAPKK